MPSEKKIEAACVQLIRDDPNWSIFHWPSDSPRKYKCVSGYVGETTPVHRENLERLRQRARSILTAALAQSPEDDAQEAAPAAGGGWRTIESAPKGSFNDPSSYFIGMRVDGLDRERMNVATCYRTDYGAFEWWGGGLEPTHWMPLPPAPTPEGE